MTTAARIRIASKQRGRKRTAESPRPAKPLGSFVVSMRLPRASGDRLRRLALRHGWTQSDASARLVEEGLRRSEFAFIDFRDSADGRQACLQGSSLAVWEVMEVLRAHASDIASAARHFRWPEAKVRAALNYAQAFPEEIEPALAANARADFQALSRMLPQAAEFIVDSTPAAR